MSGERHLVVGLGVTGRAVVRALVARGYEVVAVDDAPDVADPDIEAAGVAVHRAPDPALLEQLVAASVAVVPAPGLPDRHPLFEVSARLGVPVITEFDLAGGWDDRPIVAITGTDGKTTVTTLVVDILEESGVASQAVGNTEVPLVEAIDDPSRQVFVVEASSFRLGRSRHFAPAVAAWLNFAPDHLDVHASLADYEAAKAAIWRDQRPDQVAIGSADDPVVAEHLRAAPARQVTFGTGGDYHLAHGWLVGPGGPIAAVDDLPRRFPHDLANALAAAACAVEMGATIDAARAVLHRFTGLPHRLQIVADRGGVQWVDDSKATVPHATVAAAKAFAQVVLIAGGRNKGLDLAALADVPTVVGVVAIGEAADEVVSAFGERMPVRRAASMAEAVDAAADLAEPGQTVLLSPGCASFDWYGSYGERGDDFQRVVREHLDAVHRCSGPSRGDP